ncbi:MAG: hypothetical protein ACW963_08065 [Candidatus Sifarchaeia archaeon]|jgi:hypothetical protein
MKKYCLGEELEDYDWEDIGNHYEWVVYCYESYMYEGDGELVAFDGENLHIYQLGHCSLYGPLERNCDTISKEKYLASDNVLDVDTEYRDVRRKVLKLLS